MVELQRAHAVPAQVRHGDAALHGGHGGQGKDAGAVPRRVHVGRAGAGDAINLNMAAGGHFHPGCFQTDVCGVGD